MGVVVNRNDFLNLWLEIHGEDFPLSQKHRKDFIARKEVAQILRYKDSDIKHHTETNRLLAEILLSLESSFAEMKTIDVSTSGTDRQEAATSRSASSQIIRPSRGGKSHETGSVWTPPVDPEQARRATVNFDKQARQYP